MNDPTIAKVASAATHPRFHTVTEVHTQLKKDHDLYRFGTDEQRSKEVRLLADVLSHKLSMDSSALESLEWQYAFRRFCILTGVADTITFSATIAYDAELLNGPLAHGHWNVQADQFAKTLEVSTESFR